MQVQVNSSSIHYKDITDSEARRQETLRKRGEGDWRAEEIGEQRKERLARLRERERERER